MRYDIVPDAHVTVRRPDVVIVEGLNVLQPSPSPNDVAVSELFDFSIYVDADTDHIAPWFVDRFLALRRGAFANPNSFFNVFSHLSDEEAVQTALGLLERHQPAEPRGERAADQAPRDSRAREGRRPHRRAGAAAQAVTRASPGSRHPDRVLGIRFVQAPRITRRLALRACVESSDTWALATARPSSSPASRGSSTGATTPPASP